MRHPKREELAPVIEAVHALHAVKVRQEREAREFHDAYNDALAALAKACGVPPGTGLDDAKCMWVKDQQTPYPVE